MRNLPRSLSIAAAIFLLGACTGFPGTRFTTLAGDPARAVARIALGSCARETRPQPIWDTVLAAEPDLFLHLGDNIYGDTEDMAVMREKYLALWNQPGYAKLRRTVPVIATWDDHDYGKNDAGAEYSMKAQSKRVFLDFFGEPKSSERRTRDGGIYTSYVYGPPGKRVQIILLDTRYDRTALTKVPKPDRPQRRSQGMGYYVADGDPAARVLGDDQWAWLERQLRRPAKLRIVASSIQVLSDFTGREGWANIPQERERLIALIRRTGATGVVFVSG
ncbi:MAG: alkaline phosphatase D family protein, partial [Rhodospirillales bacterium]|nr:alkaline phosphatase D family protein [Rhodospirillales bacterium]